MRKTHVCRLVGQFSIVPAVFIRLFKIKYLDLGSVMNGGSARTNPMENHCGPIKGLVWGVPPPQVPYDPCAGYAVSSIPAMPVLGAGLLPNLYCS